MITAFEVGSVFKIIDQATPVLRTLSREVAKLDKNVLALRDNLRGLGRAPGIGPLTAKLAGINAEITKATISSAKLPKAIGSSFGTLNARMATAAANAGKIVTSLAPVTSEIKLLGEAAAVARPEIAGLARSLGLVDRRLIGIAESAPVVRTAFATTFSAASAGAAALLADVRTLNAEWRALALSVAAATRAMRVPGLRGRPALPGTGGGGGGGIHIRPLGVPLPGGHASIHAGGYAAMAGAGALAYGIDMEAKLEDAIFQMKWHAGLPNTPANDQYFRNLIQNTASTTGFGYEQIAAAATDEIRLMKGAGGKESGGLDILPEMLRAAAVEAKVKPGTRLESAMRTLVEMAHMAQEYGADDIKSMAPLFAFLSTTNPATMPQMTRAASYAMPTLHSALGMNAADILFEMTAIARAGATNTKSGTWVRAAFERALPPDPRVVGNEEYQRRIFAMHELGLVDAEGKSTILDATGHIDIDKFLRTEKEHAEKLSIVERNAIEKKAFGEQGQRGLDLMAAPAVMAQTTELMKEFPDFKARYETFFEDYSRESPVQKARETWQDLTNVLSDIGVVVLPTVNVGLRTFDEILKTIVKILPKSGVETPSANAGWWERLKVGFHNFDQAVGRGMAEGVTPGGIVGGAISLGLGVTPLPGMAIGGAGGAVIGGTYEGIKYLIGPAPSIVPPDPGDITQKQSWNVVPGASQPEEKPIHISLQVDGQKLAEVVTRIQVRDGAGAAQGAPYHDSTHSISPLDFVSVG